MKRKYSLYRFERTAYIKESILIDEKEFTFENWKELYFIIREYLHTGITNLLEVEIKEQKDENKL